MKIEMKNQGYFKDILHRLQIITERAMFSVLTSIPEKFIPQFVFRKVERYVKRRNQELKQQIVKYRWELDSLENIAREINIQTNNAPQE